MLESILTEHRRDKVFRLVAFVDDEEYMEADGFDQRRTEELNGLLRKRGAADSIEDLLDDPFRPKFLLFKDGFPLGRFSNGSFGVFNCSTDSATAEAEVQHHFCARHSGKPDRGRKALYKCFTCDFAGFVKDLRPRQAVWPELTHDSDYQFCNGLGSEAKETVDGLLAPSVRRRGGTNLPVFKRSAISNPRDPELVEVTCEP